jgi:hypothetical protein
VVVGVDGTYRSIGALRWAADEASHRGVGPADGTRVFELHAAGRTQGSRVIGGACVAAEDVGPRGRMTIVPRVGPVDMAGWTQRALEGWRATMLTAMVLAVLIIPIICMVSDEIRAELREFLDRHRAHRA